jgi:hypothetical protein
MKKIAYILPLFGLSLMLAACDFNELNFPGYDDEVAPTNVFAYEDSVTEADMADISKLGLAAATNATDSATAKALATNKYFHDVDAPAYNYIPLWLANKYKYGDPKSTVEVVTPQYIAEEGELQYIHEKYILDTAKVFKLSPEIFSESFTTSMGKFTAISVSGNQTWYWSSYAGVGFAKMSGYSSGNKVNEDWLISRAIDLTKRTDAILSFYNTHKYGTVFSKEMTLWVTDSWNGSTLDTLSWVKKDFIRAPGTDYTFVNSGYIYLTEFAGKKNVRIAFRYVSNAVESAPTWEINNVTVLETLEE